MRDAQRISSLDGLRALSIGMVLVAHAANRWKFAHYGNFGVSIFFVISGFLITWLLCQEAEKRGSVSLASFYIRRALRILPPALLFLVVVQLLGSAGLADVARNDFLHCLLFVRNMSQGGISTTHFWSLAIEEQFYLIWPFLFLLLGTVTRRLWFTAGLFTLYPAWYYYRAHHFALTQVEFDVNCVYLLAGCMLAVARHQEKLIPFLKSPWMQSPLTPWVSIVLVCWAASPKFPVGCVAYTAEAFGVAAFINYAVDRRGGVLNWAPIVWIGNLSYSLYLWQQIFCLRSKLSWAGHFPWDLLATFAAASLSFYFLEKPLADLRRRVPFIPNLEFGHGRSMTAVTAPIVPRAQPREIV